jgi:hypothetical protein
MGERGEIAVSHRRLAVAEEVEEGSDVAVEAEDEEVEGELGLQILRALSILRFFEEFLVAFMVVFMVVFMGFFFSRRSVLVAAEE